MSGVSAREALLNEEVVSLKRTVEELNQRINQRIQTMSTKGEGEGESERKRGEGKWLVDEVEEGEVDEVEEVEGAEEVQKGK